MSQCMASDKIALSFYVFFCFPFFTHTMVNSNRKITVVYDNVHFYSAFSTYELKRLNFSCRRKNS